MVCPLSDATRVSEMGYQHGFDGDATWGSNLGYQPGFEGTGLSTYLGYRSSAQMVRTFLHTVEVFQYWSAYSNQHQWGPSWRLSSGNSADETQHLWIQNNCSSSPARALNSRSFCSCAYPTLRGFSFF